MSRSSPRKVCLEQLPAGVDSSFEIIAPGFEPGFGCIRLARHPAGISKPSTRLPDLHARLEALTRGGAVAHSASAANTSDDSDREWERAWDDYFKNREDR